MAGKPGLEVNGRLYRLMTRGVDRRGVIGWGQSGDVPIENAYLVFPAGFDLAA
jgi:hypothetical protein